MSNVPSRIFTWAAPERDHVDSRIESAAEFDGPVWSRIRPCQAVLLLQPSDRLQVLAKKDRVAWTLQRLGAKPSSRVMQGAFCEDTQLVDRLLDVCENAEAGRLRGVWKANGWGAPRSEEHTSELQSLRHLVCRLLL